MKGWNYYQANQAHLNECDKRVLSVLIQAYEANGSKRSEVASRLFVSTSMVHYILSGHKTGRSYLRYLPKTLAFLKACNCRMRIEAYLIKEE